MSEQDQTTQNTVEQSTDNQPQKENDVTSQVERDRQRAVAQGATLTPDAREAAIEEQAKRSNTNQPEPEPELVNVEATTEIELVSPEPAPAFSAHPTAMLADVIEIMRPNMKLHIMIPLIAREEAEDYTLEGEDGEDYNLRNPLAAPKDDKPEGILYSQLTTILEAAAEFNNADFFALAESLQQLVMLEVIAQRFQEGVASDFPISMDVIAETTGYFPLHLTSVSRDTESVVTSIVVPMPILVNAPSKMASNVPKLVRMIQRRVEEFNVDVEISFLANPVDFLTNPGLVETVNTLTADGYVLTNLGDLEDYCEMSDAEGEDFGDDVFDEDEFNEDSDDDYEDEDGLDEDEDADEVEDEDEGEDEDEVETSDLVEIGFTLPYDFSQIEHLLEANGILHSSLLLVSKPISTSEAEDEEENDDAE